MTKRLWGIVGVLVWLATSNVAALAQDSPNGNVVDPPQVVQGPITTDPLPGDFQNVLLSSLNYVSPFASLFRGYSARSSSEDLRSYYQSAERSRLLNVPEMSGDFRRAGPTVAIAPTSGVLPILQTELPIAGGVSGLRVAENNQALPADRVWFAYNYFNNAFDVLTDGSFGLTPTSRTQSLHRSMIGVEKLLDCGRTSVEVRMPFGSAFTTRGTGGTGAGTRPFGVEADSLGNMNILLKRLLYADSERAWSAGVGFELPTGSSAVVTYADTTTVLDPEAVHIVPFLAWTRRNDCWFGHMFVQLDIQSHGDPLRTTLATAGVLVPAGRINQPLLFGADLGIGYWLVPPCECDSGLALVAEAHYSSPLSGQDRFTSTGPLVTLSTNTPVGASYEVIHLTTGLQWSMGNGWTLRSAVVLPGDTERVFDTEYLLQINRTF